MRRRLALALVILGCAPARADREAADGAAVLKRYCVRCHSGARAQADFDYVGNTPRLVAAGLIVPGDAAGSLVYRRLSLGEMPPATVKQRPTADEIAAVRDWIDAMTPVATRFTTDAAIEATLAADAAGLAAGDLASARWFTLTNVANAGVPEAQLDLYRTALAELLASLSWAPAPHAPVAVDAARTIYRVDLRELGWTAATWDAIRADYPYGVARGAGVPDAIRVDWFVATASRAPLYHDILGLPATEAELATLLGIDLAADIAAGAVARAGFTGSGVSINNRVIERHATRFGALWRSYDFRSSVGVENVFTHPLDFVPAGGEIIFNLPDGFQAYLLVDGTGRRLDKAPTAIVSDARRPDRAVETAVSCMGCHAGGIIDKPDQLREAATADLDRADQIRIRQLHPPADELTRLYAADRARFVDALASIGAAPPADPADEPITALAARYEAELDLRSAAAELGLQPDELTRRLRRAPDVKQALAGLLAGGGAVKRDAWAAVFPRAVADLGLGVPFTPASSGDLAPAVWIDRDRHSWVAIAGQAADQRGALALCRRRGLELPRAADLIAAANQGLAAGLRLDGTPAWSAGVKLDASNQRYAVVIDPVAARARRVAVGERHAIVCVQR